MFVVVPRKSWLSLDTKQFSKCLELKAVSFLAWTFVSQIGHLYDFKIVDSLKNDSIVDWSSDVEHWTCVSSKKYGFF